MSLTSKPSRQLPDSCLTVNYQYIKALHQKTRQSDSIYDFLVILQLYCQNHKSLSLPQGQCHQTQVWRHRNKTSKEQNTKSRQLIVLRTKVWKFAKYDVILQYQRVNTDEIGIFCSFSPCCATKTKHKAEDCQKIGMQKKGMAHGTESARQSSMTQRNEITA